MLTDRTKEYVAELLLGQITDTQDITGTVLEEREVAVSEAQVREVIAGFVGGYDQIPPMYSALKVNGKKLYELARAGKEVERQARHVDLPAIEILEIKFPVVKFRVECSKGTYIRSLCADIGEKLCCGGTMQSLVRTRVGEVPAGRCPDTCTAAGTSGHGEAGGSTASHRPYFSDFPMLHVEEKWRKLIDNGNAFYPGQTVEQTTHPAGEWVRIYREDDSFVGIYAYDETKEWYKPVKVFPSNTESRK